ncbi:hypothetical protein M405DRAFT_384777 [Rhizopogon salebrosus TDB-379]|nr:hypothetical protein M405DRAFT_384777 [Rhizopogon salebrosus TDB-379]
MAVQRLWALCLGFRVSSEIPPSEVHNVDGRSRDLDVVSCTNSNISRPPHRQLTEKLANTVHSYESSKLQMDLVTHNLDKAHPDGYLTGLPYATR